MRKSTSLELFLFNSDLDPVNDSNNKTLSNDISSNQLQPKKEAVDFILNYSRAHSMIKSEKIDHIEMILN